MVMKKNGLRKQAAVLAVMAVMAAALSGCGGTDKNVTETGSVSVTADAAVSEGAENGAVSEEESEVSETTALEVRFGDDGVPFVLNLEDNETAAAIAGYVGTANWRLPIYHYDDYDNWEEMQYYDIPSRYEIQSAPESVTSEKAGEVYYSEPNRILLFYKDAEVTGEYTKIGSIADSEDFREAVENNPEVEGWGNKMVLINSID